MFIVVSLNHVDCQWPAYLSGKWITTSFHLATRFESRELAFVAWNDYASNFPGWDARLLEVHEL